MCAWRLVLIIEVRYALMFFRDGDGKRNLDSINTGVLSCLDGYMNIALEQTEEHVNGVVTNRYGDAFIRGNNGALICSLLTFSWELRSSLSTLYLRSGASLISV